MKKIILFLILILVSVLVTAATISKIIEDTVIDQSNTVGGWHPDHTITNLTDGNYTSFAVTNKNTTVNFTYAMINFSKEDGSDILSKVQITYNTSLGSTRTNYTLSDFPRCWYNNPDKLLFRLVSNSTQNISNAVINETITPVISKVTNETTTLLNDTNVSLVGINIIVSTLIIFNQTIRVNIINETNDTNSEMQWANDTNITLTHTNIVDINTVTLYNCTTPYTVVNSTNYTAYADGNVFLINNTGNLKDGQQICANYTYHTGGYGEIIGVNNYTTNLITGSIRLKETRFNNSVLGVNYTYSLPLALANTRVLNHTVRLFNRTANLTILNESDSTNLVWTNNTNMTLDYSEINRIITINNCTDITNTVSSNNYTLFSTDGKILATSNATFTDGTEVCINYSYFGSGFGEPVPSSNYSINYLSGNLSILDFQWNGTLGINYTYMTDGTPENKAECYNGSEWLFLGTESNEDALFDIRMFWSLSGSNWTIDYTIIEPDQYTTYTSATIVFNITANLTLSAGNQTSVNVSFWTRINNNSAPFTLNESDQVLLNTSYVNKTVTFTDGDRVWWYWSFRDNQSRSILNTSIRLLDVDIDYQIFEIGLGINFTMNTGSAVFQGTVDVGSLTTGAINAADINTTGNYTIATQTTPIQGKDCPVGILTIDDHYIYFCNSTGNWTRAAFTGFE